MKYYPLSNPTSTGSQIKTDDYKYAGHELFLDATDVYTIQRETTFASNTYEDVTVRIIPVIDSKSGNKRSDDWKSLIFDPYDTFIPIIGSSFYFEDNYWLCVFTDNIKSTLVNCTIRRCNCQAKWIDNSGVYHAEAAIIDYDLAGTRNLERSDNLILPEGYIPFFIQSNERTRLIQANQKFLFGPKSHRVGFRIHGGGIQNMMTQQTTDEDSNSLMEFVLESYQINPDVDNLDLGVADYYESRYSISLSASQITGNIGESYPINATLLLNNIPTSGSLTYTSSSSPIATINASGSIAMVASGSTIATAYMGGNPAISASALVTVSASSTPVTTTEIRITPSDNVSILEGDTASFTSYLYVNGVQQADVFTFPLVNANVPVDHYTLSNITNNGFDITNSEMYLDYPLLINATSGSYTKQISINLNGAW